MRVPWPPSAPIGPSRVGRSGRTYTGVSLGLLPLQHPLRASLISLIERKSFDRVVLLLILANCGAMAASQPLAEAPAAWEKPAEWLFTIAFTAEALIKVGAMGFAWESRNAYVWDVWNLLDLVAIVSAWVSLLPLGAGNYAVLRSVRILRPLRTVQRIKGMRILIGSLAASLPALLDVAMLFGFLILVFGVVGVEMFAGRLHYRCVDPTGKPQEGWEVGKGGGWRAHALRLGRLPLGGPLIVGEETGDLCTCPGATTLAIERRAPEAVCPDMCAAGATCKYLDENPEGGAFSFDWILPALSDIFMCITLEGWTDLMCDASRPPPPPPPRAERRAPSPLMRRRRRVSQPGSSPSAAGTCCSSRRLRSALSSSSCSSSLAPFSSSTSSSSSLPRTTSKCAIG